MSAFFVKRISHYYAVIIIIIPFLFFFSHASVCADQSFPDDKGLYSFNSVVSEKTGGIPITSETRVLSTMQSPPNAPGMIQPAVPVSFIPNEGLTNPSVQFFVKERNITYFFTDERIILLEQGNTQKTLELDKVFVDMSGPTDLEARDLLPGTVNFLTGKKSSDWKRNISTYGSIIYLNIYPGINIRFEGDSGNLVPEISVLPNADKNQLKIAMGGIETINNFFSTGKNHQTNNNSGVAIEPPEYVSIRQLNNLNPGNWTILSGNNNTHTSLPDKSSLADDISNLLYSTYIGGTNNESGSYLAVDSEGNVYITGRTDSINFPISPSTTQTGYGGGSCDVFVTKINVAGTEVLYSTYIGGEDDDVGFGIDIDSEGNAYVTGYTWSTNFPTTTGAFQTSYGGNGRSEKVFGGDAFITKLSPTGNLVYSSYLGGSVHDRGNAITVDKDGNAFITGVSDSTNYPVSVGAYQSHHNGWGDVIISKINAEGNALLYSTYLGGGQAETGYAIDVDSEGNAYVTGVFWNGQFPTTSGAFQTSFGGGLYDTFVTKINADGTRVLYSTYLGGDNEEAGYSITVDTSGAVYVTGFTASHNYPTTAGAYQVRYDGSGGDVFITKINPSGDSLIYSTYLGGNNYDSGRSVIIDSSKNTYITGYTGSIDFPVIGDAHQKSNRGESDAFITKLDSSGSSLLYSSFLGGAASDRGDCIAMDSYGNLYVTGGSYSMNYPVTKGAVQMSNQGGSDIMVSKFGHGPAAPPILTPNNSLKPVSSSSEADYQINLSFSGFRIPLNLSPILKSVDGFINL